MRIPHGELNRKPVNVILGYDAVMANATIGSPSFNARYFTAAAFGGINDYLAAFDSYRIEKIEITFLPSQDDSAGLGNTGGYFITVFDYDDDTALATLGQALAYENAYTVRGDQGHVRCFKPRVMLGAEDGAVTSSVVAANQWIASADPNVRHYGLKTAWSPVTAAFSMSGIVRAHFQFKNTR
jgi:hypothetical protein